MFTTNRRLTQLVLLLSVASAALIAGIFIPVTQMQKFWPSGTVSSEKVEETDRVLQLAYLSPNQRQTELEELTQGSTTDLERSRARYLLASDLLGQNQPEQAIELLAGLEQEYPNLAGNIALKRAQAYEMKGDATQTQQVWLDLVQRYPNHPVAAEALYVLGKTKPEHWDQAIAKFPAHPRTVEIAQTRLKQNPNQPDLLRLIARHGIYLEDYGTYLELLKAKFGPQLTPEDWEVIAFGSWEKQDYGKGAIAYAKAPRTPQNLYRHARGLWLDDKIPESRKAYEALIKAFPNEQNPQGEDAGFGLLRLSRLQKPQEAVPLLDQVIARFPRHAPEALLDKSKLLDKLKSPESASKTRQVLLKQYSHSEAAAQLRWELAQEAAKGGKTKIASDWAKQLVAENSDSELAPEAAFWVGEWAEKLGSSKDAQKAFEYVVARHPESYYAWRSAVQLGWPVGEFTTVREMAPKVEYPSGHPSPPAGSDSFKELYQLGQHQDAWTLWQVEFQNRQQPSVAEQYTDGLVRLGIGDNLDGLWMLSSLSTREDPEERSQYLALKKTPEYWQALYPFPYLDTIVNWSKERQLNPVLVTALIRQESRFMPSIKSVVGATGLMQVMPETGAEVAKKMQLTSYSLEDINDNVNLGTYYLDFTHQQYNNNSLLAVASYNAGPNAVSEWVNRFSFNDPDAFVEQIPYPETYGYVKSVFGNYWNYLRIYNPEISQKVSDHVESYR
ncbi:MAG: transglycosylase SLT domain-containing protein [Microcoleaceae cyanobacterium]